MAIAPVPVPAMPDAMNAMTAQFAGMTADQAYNTFLDQKYESGNDVKIGYTTVTGDKPAISGDTNGTITSNTNPDPVDAWHDYVENDPDVSSETGGIRSGSTVSTIALSIIEKTDLSPEAVVPVAVPLDAAIVATSQALGVSIDAAQLDVETKQKFANSIVQSTGMVYDKAKNLVLAWKDKLGNILFPKSTLEAAKDVLDSEGIGGEGGIIQPPADSGLSGSVGVVSTDTAYLCYIGSGNYHLWAAFGAGDGGGTWVASKDNANSKSTPIFCSTIRGATAKWSTKGNYSDTPPSITPNGTISASTQYTYNGLTVYYGSSRSLDSSLDFGTTIYGAGRAAWVAMYGVASGDYPEGTSRSEAPSYTPSTIPAAGSIVTDNGGRIPTVAINIPDNPYDATGSTIDPTTPTDDENAGVIFPGLPKEVPDTANPDAEPKEESVPIPLPIPDTKVSNPAIPLVNPSVVDQTLINELVEELANTLDPQPGQSTGIIAVPPMPSKVDPSTGDRYYPSIVPSSGSGFIHVYNPTTSEFIAFGNWLWVTYADATIDKIWNNPFDGVLGAHELYATPNRDGRDNIRSGFLTCPTTADLVRNRYTEIDCGTVIVPEFYGNYLDYSPYSQAYIYLPFIGINEVSIDDIVGHAVNIRYRVDSYSGSCIAMIFVAKDGYQNLCYQFAGNCSVEVPLAGGSQAAIKAGVLQAEAYARAAMISSGANAISGLGSALMGNLSGALSSAAYMATNYANAQAGVEAARVANKSSVQHSGQFGASHGAMGEKIPFIIVRNPVQVKVVNYNDDYGYPAHKRVIVGGCSGYLRVREVNVISAHATDAEKAAIEMLLKNGVYIS